tara:strand:- start:2508 stop:3401 length:894 start_codon:yes stop_codon:yes gene_type:complete
MKNLEKPIIIIGFGRSGTSIISDIILSHHKLAFTSNYNLKCPNSIYINLLRNLFDNNFFYIQGQKKQLNSVSILNKYTFRNVEAYKFWQNLTGVDVGKGFLNTTDLSNERINYINKELNRLLKFQRKERLGFKVTGPSRLRFFNQIFPDANYIYVKRDPVANIKSFVKVDFNKKRKNALWWQGDRIYSNDELKFVDENKNNPELIAALQYYKVSENHFFELNKCGLQSKVIDVSYENFISNPYEEIVRVLDFVDLSLDKRIKNFITKSAIYNRNAVDNRYFSDNIELKIRNIAINGI